MHYTLILPACLLILVAGCGGTSNTATGTTGNGVNPNPYAGTYTGAWSWPYQNQSGNAAGTVTSAGGFTAVENDTVNVGVGSAFISGTVAANGTFTGSYELNNQTTQISGAFSKGSQGQTIVTFPLTINGTLFTNQVTFAVSNAVSYAGSFTGTWSAPSLNESGNAAFTIGPAGEMYGSYTVSGGATSLLDGIVTASGLFSGAAYSSGHNFGGSGSFNLNGTNLTGSVTEAVSGQTEVFSFDMND